MNKSKSFGKKDRPLEKGQQTLAAFFSKSKSLQTKSKCSVCLQQISTPRLAEHQRTCTATDRKPAFSKEDDDSDIEIIEDTKTPIKKAVPSKPTSASTKDSSGTTNGAGGSSNNAVRSSTSAAKSSTSAVGSTTCAAGSSIDAAESATGTAGSSINGETNSSIGVPDSASDDAYPSSTSGAAESVAVPPAPRSTTPCEDDIPSWGRGSPQISDVIGGGIAAAFCETVWSHSDSASERSESSSNTPKIRRQVADVGGWLVSPTRSPSVSPSVRVLPSPGDVTAAVTSSSARPPGGMVPPGSRVRLSPAVAGRTGRFAHSAMLSGSFPPPKSPAPSQRQGRGRSKSPRQNSKENPGQSAGKSPSPWKSPGRSPWKSSTKSPGGSCGTSPAQSPNRRLPKTNPLRYLNSPSSARRRLYRTSSGEGLGSAASTAASTTGSSAGLSAGWATGSGSRLAAGDGERGERCDTRRVEGQDTGHVDTANMAGKEVGNETGRAVMEPEKMTGSEAGRADEKAGETSGKPSKSAVTSNATAGRVNGVIKLADFGLLRCDSQERLIGNFVVDSDNAMPCSPISVVSSNGPPTAPGSPSDCVPPPASAVSQAAEDSNTASTATSSTVLTRSSTPDLPSAAAAAAAAAELDLSMEEEELLTQEFSAEMPEVALLSPRKHDASQPYYLQNFLYIVDSVLGDDHHSPLLDDSDRDVIRRLRELPASSQMLYVRMFQRKHAWLRPEKLRYPEIGDETAVGDALDKLAATRLLDTEKELSGAVELAELLPAPELRQLCQQLHLTLTGNRPELLARLAELGKPGKKRGAAMFGAASPGEVAARRARKLLGKCFRVSAGPRRVLLRVLTLFHLPLYEDDEDTSQQLLKLLMVNLGRMVYPPVTVAKETAIFATRDDLLRYEAASQIERQLRVAMETKQWDAAYDAYQAAESMLASLSERPELERHDAALPPFLRRFTASSIVTYILSKSVEVLQRRREHEAAVILLRGLLSQKTYLPDYRGFWADRLALTLQKHLRKPDEALTAAKEALADPEIRGGRRLALEQRLVRLEPSPDDDTLQPDHLPSVEIEARCLPRDVPGLKMVFLRPDRPSDDVTNQSDVTGYVSSGDVTVCSVEELALSHYSSRYSEGVHREGAPTVTIFALLFWDILYSTAVPDSFRSAYQTLPLDLNSPAFYTRRREAIEARLTQLQTETEESACFRAAAVWEAHHGCLSLAAWDVFRDCDHALGLIRCLGMELVTAICRRLATEYRFTRSGFPDLVLWNPATRTARIVEVKGPNDRLSTKQMLWIRYLLEHGAEAEVCYVRALGRRGTGRKQAEGKRKQTEGRRRKAEGSPKKRRRTGGLAGAAGVGNEDGCDGNGAEGGEDGDGASKKQGEGDGKVTKRKRGRPRKVREETDRGAASSGAASGSTSVVGATVATSIEMATDATPSRAHVATSTAAKRGRPRKKQVQQARSNDVSQDQAGAVGNDTLTQGKSEEGTGQRGKRRGGRSLEDGKEDSVSGKSKRARTEAGGRNRTETSRGGKRPRGRPRKKNIQEEADAGDVEVIEVSDDDESKAEGPTRKGRAVGGRRTRGQSDEDWGPGPSQQASLWSTGDSSGSDFE